MDSMKRWGEKVYEGATPGRVAGVVVLGGLIFFGWRVTGRVKQVKGYWDRTKAETVVARGVKSNWSAGPVEFFRLNDVIMGGRSTSEIAADSDGRLVFTGVISTIGGGFAAMRSTEAVQVQVPPGATAVRVVAEGDGQLWKVTLGTGHGLIARAPAYTHDFLTTRGKVEEYRFPLKDFVPQVRGRTAGEKGVEASQIAYVGIILSLVTMEGQPNPNFGDGPFKFVLHEVTFESDVGDLPAGARANVHGAAASFLRKID